MFRNHSVLQMAEKALVVACEASIDGFTKDYCVETKRCMGELVVRADAALINQLDLLTTGLTRSNLPNRIWSPALGLCVPSLLFLPAFLASPSAEAPNLPSMISTNDTLLRLHPDRRNGH